MDKKTFLSLFKENDEYMISGLWNDIELAEEIEIPVFTKEFYPPVIWSYLEKNSINGLKFLCVGLNSEAEKRNIMIAPKNYDTMGFEFPVIYFKINGQNKFRELQHKDFLGTIMSLGIKREVLGDLVVKNSVCFGIIIDEKYAIIENIEKIGNIPVKIEKIQKTDVPENEFKTEIILISSLRLDSFVSAVTGLSRQKSVDELEKGNILLNYNLVRDKSTEIKEGDTLTIKKVGKFRFEEIIGESRKNKIRIKIKKFI